jgi:signal transduction histidine kinase
VVPIFYDINGCNNLFATYRYRLNQLNKLVAVRTKISRDLHDEVGSTLSGIGLLSEVALQQLDREKKAEVKSSFTRSM